MAKIYKKTSDLEADYIFHHRRGRLSLILTLPGVVGIALAVFLIVGSGGIAAMLLGIFKAIGVSVIVGTLSIIGLVLFAVSAIYTLITFSISLYHFNRATIYKRGIEGEAQAASIISRLPDGFYGIQNVVVSFEGKKSELDIVVIGPTGVFIVETKNRNGDIRGNFDDRTWTQYKVGRGGTPYSNDFYSPVKQVGTHVYRLAHFLRDKGARVHVDGVVYFSSPEADVRIGGTQGNIPVFAYSSNGQATLLKHIISGKEQLDNDTIGKVCRLLAR